MKEIQLTKESISLTYYGTCSTSIDITEPTLLLPPKPKTVKLNEFPDGIIVSCQIGQVYVYSGNLYTRIAPYGYDPNSKVPEKCYRFLELAESPKQVWEGGECPVPDGVVIRASLRDGTIFETDHPEDIRWNHLPAYSHADCIWYQILRLADGWELVR